MDIFQFFKKGNTKPPAFTLIKNFYKRDHYFTRSGEWGWLEEKKIFIKDPRKPNLVTPTPWAQHIFLSANGDITVEAFVYNVAAQYENKVPDELEQTIIFELSDLVNAGFINLAKIKQPPQNDFLLPGLLVK